MANETNWNVIEARAGAPAGPIFVNLDGRRLATAVALAVSYFSMAKLGLSLSFKPEFVAALWPPNAVLLAALLLTRSRHWWWLLLAMVPAELLADYQAGISWQQSLIFVAADWTEVLFAAIPLRRLLGSTPRFETLRSTFSYIAFAVLLAPFAGACVGGFVPVVTDGLSAYWPAWRIWFMGDAITHLTLTPAILLWTTEGIAGGWRRPISRYVESAGVAVGLVASSLIVFGGQLLSSSPMPTLVFSPLAFLLWLAVRFGPRGTFSAAAVVSLAAIWNASHGVGPFTALAPGENVFHLQIFLVLALAPTMLLAVIIREQREAELLIQRLNADLEDRVRQRTTQLELINRELESFSFAVSHDLRAPLRSIDGFSQLLLEDCDDALDDTGRDHLFRIRRAASRMHALVDDLLMLSRLSRQKMTIQEVDLSVAARDVAAELCEQDPDCHVDVLIEDGLVVDGEPQLLRIMLHNLLDNAFKFTSKTADPKVELARVANRGGAVFCIRDNGVGFHMTSAGKLFTPFQRLHSEAEFSGSGIGLATVQRIVNRHGGTIWAESEPGRGASFFFSLQPDNRAVES